MGVYEFGYKFGLPEESCQPYQAKDPLINDCGQK